MHTAEPLLTIPGAELHVVEAGVQSLLDRGDFTVTVVDAAAAGSSGANNNNGGSSSGTADTAATPTAAAAAVRARVGATDWPLGKHLPALKAAPCIYSFGLEHTRARYYCLVLPPCTPADALAAVEDVLRAVAALSTARAVDAAAEEADARAGGKGAAEAAAEASAAEAAVAEAGAAAKPAAAAVAAATAAAAAAHPASGVPHAVPHAVPQQPPLPQQQEQQQAPPPVPPPPTSTADRVASAAARGLLTGGAVVAGAVARASAAASDAVKAYAERQMAAPSPAAAPGGGATAAAGCPPPGPPARVSPYLRAGLKVAAVAAGGAAYATGKLAALVGDASYWLALKVAKALPGGADPCGSGAAAGAANGGSGGCELGPGERSAFKTVGAAGLVAYVQVYDELEKAVRDVAAASTGVAAQYLGFKYGPEAGALAAEGAPVARDLLAAAQNCTRLGARAVIGGTAKRAAKIYLKAHVAGLGADAQLAERRARAAGAGAEQGVPAAAAATR